MYTFSKASRKQLYTLHMDLRKILQEAITICDFSILEGHRSVERQQQLFKAIPPKTKVDGVIIKSKHNFKPSLAVDILPYKKGVNPFLSQPLNLARYYFLMGVIKATANKLLRGGDITHDVRFGLDWDNDDIYEDQTFHDLAHVELRKT